MPVLQRLKRRMPCVRRKAPIDLRNHREMRRPILVEQPEQMFRAPERPHEPLIVVDFLRLIPHRLTPEVMVCLNRTIEEGALFRRGRIARHVPDYFFLSSGL
ncbi:MULTISPECIES: hypothetical protein [unclassified Burkholderia]|uniref:hypothetical protein n=1 Tax=unclassified Burkholderia TaxID=2613784 RepID=UPI001E656454|nr:MULTISPECIES: hypothetical protein [unclassified Burkholderia]UEP33216.1 hypothetical protein LMA01_34915 [Burkholderia sp. B21-007]UEP46671.1 hypothetical protein LMA02_31360 [Burkholderia sp. B21-005]